MPALLMRMSIPPKASFVACTAASTSARCETSQRIAIAVLLIAAAASRAAGSLISAMATRAPSRAKSSAMRLPKPDAPPVMSAALLSNRMVSSITCSIRSRAYPEGKRPPKASFGARAGAVFATDPVGIAKPIELREDLRVVHLAFIGLMARRHGRDLHMTYIGKVFFESPDEIAPDNLGMIEIELDAQIWTADLGDDVRRLFDAGEEVIRPIARIDGLDQARDVALARCIRRRHEIADEGPLGGGTLLRRHFPRKAMNLASTGGGDVVDALRKQLGELLLTSRNGPYPEFSPGQLARARIDAEHGQAMPIELRFHSGRCVIIRQLQLHGRKASCRRGRKPLDHPPLGKEIGEVGSKPRHENVSLSGRWCAQKSGRFHVLMQRDGIQIEAIWPSRDSIIEKHPGKENDVPERFDDFTTFGDQVGEVPLTLAAVREGKGEPIAAARLHPYHIDEL